MFGSAGNGTPAPHRYVNPNLPPQPRRQAGCWNTSYQRTLVLYTTRPQKTKRKRFNANRPQIPPRRSTQRQTLPLKICCYLPLPRLSSPLPSAPPLPPPRLTRTVAIFHFPSRFQTPIPRPQKASGLPATHDSQNQYRSFLVQALEGLFPGGSRRTLLHLAQLMRRPSPKTAAGCCCCSCLHYGQRVAGAAAEEAEAVRSTRGRGGGRERQRERERHRETVRHRETETKTE